MERLQRLYNTYTQIYTEMFGSYLPALNADQLIEQYGRMDF